MDDGFLIRRLILTIHSQFHSNVESWRHLSVFRTNYLTCRALKPYAVVHDDSGLYLTHTKSGLFNGATDWSVEIYDLVKPLIIHFREMGNITRLKNGI